MLFCSEKTMGSERTMQEMEQERKKRWLWLLLPVFLVCGLIWYLLQTILPEELTLVEGQRVEFSIGLPISARSEESVEVLGVTTTPLADQTQLQLGTSIAAESLAQGETTVTFYLLNTIPLKTVPAQVVPRTELIPCGKTVGVQMDTDGLLVLDTGYVENRSGEKETPTKNILRPGDLILQANGEDLPNKETFLQVVEENGEKPMTLLIRRDGEEQTVEATPVYSCTDGSCKLGVWIRDSIQGIGTVTFYDEETDSFGALGHGIYDVDTGGLMELKQGKITEAVLTEIVKGQKGAPGELSGRLETEEVLGEIKKNTEIGIYGNTDQTAVFTGKSYPVASQTEIHTGDAVILSNIEGDEVKSYDIEIEKISRFGSDASKGLVVHITDEELLEKTGGIVQGMSGSPILQDGKLVGAVTHVFVQDPTRGYGIFIENMLEEERAA